MDDPTTKEIASMIKAHEAAGEFLSVSDTTDLAAMTYDQQMQFVDCLITSYCDAMKAANGFSLRDLEQVPY